MYVFQIYSQNNTSTESLCIRTYTDSPRISTYIESPRRKLFREWNKVSERYLIFKDFQQTEALWKLGRLDAIS